MTTFSFNTSIVSDNLTATTTVYNLRTGVYSDATGGTITSVTSTERGYAVARTDGDMTIDLIGEAATSDFEIVYVRTGGSAPGTVTLTVSITDVDAIVGLLSNDMTVGWSTQEAIYLPEIDWATNETVVEKLPDTREIYISSSGFTKAEIESRESIANATSTWLRDNTALTQAGVGQGYNPSGTLKYGESEDLALDFDRGNALYVKLKETLGSSVHVYLKRGDTFTDGIEVETGYSKLYPDLVADYGAGAVPVFTGDGHQGSGYSRNVVAKNFQFSGDCRWRTVSSIVLDGPVNQGALDHIDVQGVATWNEGITVRRYFGTDINRDTPIGTDWGVDNTDRVSGLYADTTNGLLVEYVFLDEVGFEDGYYVDRRGTGPQSPTDRSHGIYLQQNNLDVTVENAIISYPSFSPVQFRPGGYLKSVVGFGHNGTINFGTGAGTNNGLNTDFGRFSYVRDVVLTEPAQKDTLKTSGDPLEGEEGTLAGGISNQNGILDTVSRVAIMNGTLGTAITSINDTGIIGRASSAAEVVSFTAGTSPALYDYVVSNFLFSSLDENTSGLNTTNMDAATIAAYNDDWKSTTGSTIQDFRDNLRLEAEPWDQIPDMLSHFLTPAELYQTPTSGAQTCTFNPSEYGAGVLASIEDNWSGITGRLPGDVSGDSVDLFGHRVFWYKTPKNQLVNFDVGGGQLTLSGGKLAPSGTVTLDGGSVAVKNGAKLVIDGLGGSDTGSITVDQARFENTGTIASAIDLTGGDRGEVIFGSDASSYTIPSGSTVVLHGSVAAGFKGTAGGSAGLTITGTLDIRSEYRVLVGSMSSIVGFGIGSAAPPVGGTVTYGASNYTATVASVERVTNTTAYIVLQDATGPIANSDTITGDRWVGPEFYDATGATIGTVTSFVASTPKITEIHSDGVAANVASTVTCGGTLDMSGAVSGTHEVINVDTVSGTFGTLVGCSNPVYTATTVTVDVA